MGNREAHEAQKASKQPWRTQILLQVDLSGGEFVKLLLHTLGKKDSGTQQRLCRRRRLEEGSIEERIQAT